MSKRLFFQLPGGRLKRVSNRMGGDDGDNACAVERRRLVQRLLDAEFSEEVEDNGSRPEGSMSDTYGNWTVIVPCSGQFHNRTWVIEGDYDLGVRVFAARNGGRHPAKTSCDCGCGPDHFVHDFDGSLLEATTQARNCPNRHLPNGSWQSHETRRISQPGKYSYHTLDQFLTRDDVVLIRAEDITDADRAQPMPQCTSPSDYSEDEQTVAWLLQAEM